MIATTIKGTWCVRLSADYNIDTETVNYEVYCAGITFEFPNFAPAARVYKNLSDRIEGKTFTVDCINDLVKGARALGYKVTEVR